MNPIFVHGVNHQITGYSRRFFNLILKDYIAILKKRTCSQDEIQAKTSALVQNELLWADTTTDLTNRYLTFEFGPKKRSLYIESDLKLPPNVKRWVNILDKDDAIARYCRPFFKNIDIQELEVNTGSNPIKSHGYYWQSRPTARLIARVIDEVQE